ncbi:type II secretion system F family protein [Candidatus Micrarchaeota archaeon]|nr:type II secretion system F family protein [Candidatus Micrarchaeota archaeon]
MNILRFYLLLSQVFPKKLVDATGVIMVQGGYKEMPARIFLGFAVFFSACVGLIALFVSPFLIKLPPLLYAMFFLAFFLLTAFLFYILLIITADRRASNVELILPDVLQIISANLRAGMTLENAVWLSVRPEFGAFKDELKRVSSDTFAGVTFRNSILQMSRRVRSPILERSVKLIAEGVTLGGEMAKLLDEVAKDVKSVQAMKKEIISATMTYTIFIIFASVLVSPILFAISVYYAETSEVLAAKVAKSGQINVPKGGGGGGVSLPTQSLGFFGQEKKEGGIKASDLRLFAVASILIATIFGSLSLAVVRHGKASRGIKYVPLFSGVALILFFAASSLLRNLLGSMFGGG